MICRLLLFIALSVSAASAGQDTTPFPTPPDKKGIQVQMVPDAISLGIHHAAINVSFGALMAAPDGSKHLINLSYARSIEAQVKPLSDAGIVVYLILTAYPTHDAAKDALLLHPHAKPDQKYNIAAFNTATPEGIANYRALVDFLAERFSGAHPEAGRAWGYIIGNEVNSQWLWYNLDHMPMEGVVSEYEKAVRIAHEAIQQHSANARVYLSFDHHWNSSMPNISDQEAYKGRDLLDAFAKLARERGDFEWHVAHHPYADNLRNPRTWLDKDAWPTDDSPHITFKNLEVACRHMEKPEMLWQGKPRRIILSEQGLNCLDEPDGETLQAAGYAYAWEKIARQPLIDAFILHRHVDHAKEGGLRLGLWTFKPGTISDPDRKRQIYDLFKKAGTPEWSEAAKFALPIVGLKSWDELAK
jgi:Family of unknown function (DUF5722)